MCLPDDPVWLWVNAMINIALGEPYYISSYNIVELGRIKTVYTKRKSPRLEPIFLQWIEFDAHRKSDLKAFSGKIGFLNKGQISIFLPGGVNEKHRLEKWLGTLSMHFTGVDFIEYVESWFDNDYSPPILCRQDVLRRTVETLEHLSSKFVRSDWMEKIGEDYDRLVVNQEFADIISNDITRDRMASRLTGICMRALSKI